MLVSTLIIFSIFFITLKYHYRYNENRKFHELGNVNLSESVPAKKIHENLSGLNWINPFYDKKPDDEINLLKKGTKIIQDEKKEIILFTHYLFYDTITNKKLNYPARTFTMDGASIPTVGTKYFEIYKNFLHTLIKTNNIEKIYFFKHEGVSIKNITNYLKSECYNKTENSIFYIFELKCIN